MIIPANQPNTDNIHEKNTIDNIKTNDSNYSVSCSIANSSDLNDLYEKLSSGYSSNIECEYQNEIGIHSLSGVKDYLNFVFNQREIILEEVKDSSCNFINDILDQYNEKNKMSTSKDISVSTKMKTGYTAFPKTPTLSTENEIKNANRLMRELQSKEEANNIEIRAGKKKLSVYIYYLQSFTFQNYKKKFKEPDFNHLNNLVNNNNNKSSEEIESDKNKNVAKSKSNIQSSDGYVQTITNNEEISKKDNSKES